MSVRPYEDQLEPSQANARAATTRQGFSLIRMNPIAPAGLT